jgi:hypothetical protein
MGLVLGSHKIVALSDHDHLLTSTARSNSEGGFVLEQPFQTAIQPVLVRDVRFGVEQHVHGRLRLMVFAGWMLLREDQIGV